MKGGMHQPVDKEELFLVPAIISCLKTKAANDNGSEEHFDGTAWLTALETASCCWYCF